MSNLSAAVITVNMLEEVMKERNAYRAENERLREALEMVRDADNDCRLDGLPTIPPFARAKIDRALIRGREDMMDPIGPLMENERLRERNGELRAENERLLAAWDNTRDSLRISVKEIERLRAALRDILVEVDLDEYTEDELRFVRYRAAQHALSGKGES